MNVPAWYRHIDAALLRASTSSADVVPRHWPVLQVGADVEPWCAWIRQAWARVGVADAVTVASPVLAERVEAILDGSRPDAAQIRRVVMSLARYLVRMRGRATPFG